jgi:hypothetical protein
MIAPTITVQMVLHSPPRMTIFNKLLKGNKKLKSPECGQGIRFINFESVDEK